ncbi:putative transposase-associated domain-containing protein [Tanacetum coccineum]
MSVSQDEIPPPPPPPPSSSQTPTQQTPHTVSTIKLLILKKGEYDIWVMKMEHYLAHTDYLIWEVIQNGNVLSTLLMALPEDQLAKFHKMTDAKEMWDAIKSRFGGNDESKKMHKFQSLLSQLEIHRAGVSNEDANQKFLRSLPSAWSQVSLIMRTKPGVDSLSFDDLYNNLRVFENDVKGSTASSSSTQNVAFVFENTSSTNDDLEQLDEFDLEEMDLKWQVAMISMRMKIFYKKTGRKLQFDAKEPIGFDKTKVECYNCHKTGHFARECRTKGNQDSRRRDAWNSSNKDGRRSGKQEDSKALVTIDGEGVDWTSHSEEEEDYALMACNSLGSDTEVFGVTSLDGFHRDTFINMDKSWMETNRISKSYVDGVAAFTDYAVHNLQKTGNIDPRVNKKHIYIPCPCTKCLNHIEHKVEEVQYHLYRHGIDISYTKWTKHGEEDEPSISAPKPVNATTEFVDDMDFAYIPTDGPATVEMVNATKDNFDVDDLVKFQELLLDAEKPLYEGCPDFTKLSAIVKLLNLKGKYGASDKFFTELLGLIKKMLPAGNEMVEKTYQAKKVMRLMGSGYKKIHVCINNCLLYWKNDKDLTACRTCGTSRWKVDNKTKKVYENIPAKVMWYFPIIPRLQRLFKIESISEDLRWHATRRITDGVLRHPADSQAWRTIDEKFPEIAEDTRNLRLGISADGVDVNTGNRHHRYPGNDIDIFLEPLVDDLHTLFETRVDTYDASTKDNFNLCAVMLWTINDYSALEKNVTESIVETLLHVLGKTKDGLNTRLDLAELGVKPELFAMQDEDKTTLPPAGYTLTNAEKDIFCEMLHNIKVPEGYCSNFSSLVNLKDRKLIGLKSHDYHMLMQEFLPIAIRSIMHPPTRYAIIRFCFFFKSICSKEIILQELDKMQAELVVTLCLLEKFFPPSFFDIMIHLTVHLTREVKLCGPICFRWMYPFERCMKVIKGHVRNRNKPEGCIAEETIAEETIEFFSEYHKSMETIGIPPDKHETYENEEGKPLSAGKSSEVSAELFQKAHLYVIQNTDEIVPYIERHKQVLKTENPGKRIAFLENEHSKSFAKWLREEVERELAIDKESVSETVRWISYGPRATVVKYDAYNINGYTFRTKCHDGKVYQNSGVSVEAIDLHISKEVATTRQAYYYGVLQEIWVLDYRFRQIPLFKCDWVNHKSGGVKRDKLGYTLVDLNNLGHKVDPFVLASQALQVFYVKDPVDKKLSIVFKTPPKNYKDTYDEVDEEFSTVIHHRNDNVLPLVDRRDLANESRDDYYRKDCGGVVIRKSK